MKNNKSPDNINEFKRLKLLVSNSIMKAKKETWATFCNSISSSTPSSEAWSKIKKVQGKNTKRRQVLNKRI